MAKLVEFNERNGDRFKITDDQLTSLRLLSEPDIKLDVQVLEEIVSPVVSKWPTEETFPLLHILCSNVVRDGVSKDLASKLYKMMKSHRMLISDSPQTRMCLRVLVSFFTKEASRAVLLEHREDLIGDINSLVEEANKEVSPQVENAVASMAINFAKAIHDEGGDSEASFQLVSGLTTVFLPNLKGPDALYKVIVALATLIKLDKDVKALAEALELKNEFAKIPKGRMTRLDQCVKECQALLC